MGRTEWPDKLSEALQHSTLAGLNGQTNCQTPSGTAHGEDRMARQTVRHPPAQHMGMTEWPDKLSSESRGLPWECCSSALLGRGEPTVAPGLAAPAPAPGSLPPPPPPGSCSTSCVSIPPPDQEDRTGGVSRIETTISHPTLHTLCSTEHRAPGCAGSLNSASHKSYTVRHW
eukprot:688810-Rhodomonas_salina.1